VALQVERSLRLHLLLQHLLFGRAGGVILATFLAIRFILVFAIQPLKQIIPKFQSFGVFEEELPVFKLLRGFFPVLFSSYIK
jgi:hypothetical protein